MRTTALVIFMLMVTSLIPVLATSEEVAGVPTLGDRPDGWWMGYHRDENANGIDDLLDRAYLGEGGPFEIVLTALDHIPTDEDVEWLEDRGFTVIYAARNFETIVLENVDGGDLDELVGLDGLLLLEVPPELEYMLNVAVPSLKIRDSAEYSPFTAWELGYKGDGVNIAIMDSGVNDQIPIGHSMVDDMDDNPTTYDPKHIAGVDGITGVIVGGAAVNPEDSDSAHGTHVAGDAMGTGTDHQGPAPEARLIDIRVGSLTNLNMAAVLGAIDWCIDNNETDWENDGDANNGVPVLSMSFGGGATNGNDQMSQAVNDAVEAGIVCVIAAGNNGPNNNGLSAPGSADRSINVASYDDHNSVDRSDDTMRGDDGDSDVYDEMKPHIAAVGTGVTSALAWSGYLLVSMDGTSMATPEVSGLIALMLEANPSLRPGAPRYEEVGPHLGLWTDRRIRRGQARRGPHHDRRRRPGRGRHGYQERPVRGHPSGNADAVLHRGRRDNVQDIHTERLGKTRRHKGLVGRRRRLHQVKHEPGGLRRLLDLRGDHDPYRGHRPLPGVRGQGGVRLRRAHREPGHGSRRPRTR